MNVNVINITIFQIFHNFRLRISARKTYQNVIYITEIRNFTRKLFLVKLLRFLLILHLKYNIAPIEKATNNSQTTIFFSAKRYLLEGNRVKNQKVRAKVYVINFLLDGWDKANLF